MEKTVSHHLPQYLSPASKVSPDGLLLQSSTVADSVPFQFSDGLTELVPCSYIEFAECLVLPKYKKQPEKSVEITILEVMANNKKRCIIEIKGSGISRREGFEVGNADKIFESTYKDQLTRRGA